MTTLKSIDKLLENDRRLGNIILSQTKEISFELFSEWRNNRQKIGEYLVDISISFIAHKYEVYILSNPLNPSSYAHFMRSDVQSKTFSIRQRTLRSGICSGFLEAELSEFSKKHLDFIIGEKQFFAVNRAGKECLVREINTSDRLLDVCCYDDETLIVSDVDLVTILSKDVSNILLNDPLYGELNTMELKIICDLNHYFRKLVCKYFPSVKSLLFRLVAHGPASKFSYSKSSHIHYPLKIYTPLKDIEYLKMNNESESHREFLEFNLKATTLGYQPNLNPKWVF